MLTLVIVVSFVYNAAIDADFGHFVDATNIDANFGCSVNKSFVDTLGVFKQNIICLACNKSKLVN